ncbi:MAG: CHAT domain-containing protein [Candidatus Binatus sp.]
MDAEQRPRRGKLTRSFILVAALTLAACGVSSAASSTITQPAPQSSAGGKPEELLLQGAAAIRTGQIEVGIDKYKAALDEIQQQDKGKRSAIELQLGIVYQKAQRWQESADELKAAIRDNPNLGYLPYSLLGFAYMGLGRWQDSLVAFQQAAKLKPDDAGVQVGLGSALAWLGKSKEAIELLEKAVRQNPTLAVNHFTLGFAYSQSGRFDEAIKEFNEAIKLNPDNSAAYLYMGEAFGKSGHSDQEIIAEQQAIRLKPDVPEAYYLLGTAYGTTNRLPEAASAYAKAIALKADYFDAYAQLAFVDVQLGRLPEAWNSLQRLSRVNGTSSNYASYSALAFSYQTFGLWQRTVDSASEAVKLRPDCAECYWYLGNGYANIGLVEDARHAYQRALSAKPRYSPALYGLGELAETSGDFAAAQSYLDDASRALPEFTNARQRTQIEGSILAERGNIERDLGNYDQAFAFYTQGVEVYRSIADHKNAGLTLAKVAEIYRQIGDFRASARWYDYALMESRQAGDDDAQMTDLLRLYYVAGQIGDLSAQAKYEQQGEELASSVLKDRSKAMNFLLGDSFLAIGEMEAEYGTPADAMTMLRPLVAVYRKLPQNEQTLRKLALASVFLGDAYMRVNDYADALSAFAEAEAIAEKYKSPEVMWVYARIGYAYEKQGDLDAALSYDRRAAEVMERFGGGQQLPELQLSSRELAWGLYENLTRVTLELYAKAPSAELLDQAFTYHEEGKARALLDLLNDAGVRAREGVDPALVRQEDAVRVKISALQNAFSDATVSELRKVTLQDALTEQTAELRQVHEKIAATNAKYASMESSTPVRVSDVQALLDDDTVLLEYDLGPSFSGVGVITNRQIRLYRLPAQDVIDKTLDQFLPTLRQPLFGSSEINSHMQLAKQLYADLVAPVRDQIAGKHHIVVVPDADLFYLPFEAIIDADAKLDGPADSLASQPYLGKAYDFSYAPSASVLVALKGIRRNPSSAQRPLLAFGDPAFQSTPAPSQLALSTRGAYAKMGVGFDRLPYSAEEVHAILAVYGISPQSSSVYLGSNATKRALLGLDLSQYRTLHFATHAVMGDEVRWINQPALIFSPDSTGAPDSDLLKMSEIFNLRLKADLVVLSACETARGKMSRGEGIVGLTSAFLFAGSRSVVASLWEVSDESTSLFMESFYRGLKSGLPKPDALRRARLETMRKQIKSAVTGEQQSLASPFFWAPFVLIGEWN